MDIIIKIKKLKKIANSATKIQAAYGAKRARALIARLEDLKTAETLEDTRYLPGRYHELTGNRKGQWACDLDQPYRLIFEPTANPIPTNEDGQYLWNEITIVAIMEITDYH